MAGILDCGICDNTYDETERKPLKLLCGHTYCQQCLHNVVSGSSPACPSCRKEIVTPVDQLTVNFMLIPSSSGEAASESLGSTEMFCISHQKKLDYWCSQCKVLICKECLVQTHAKHELILAEKVFADEQILPDVKGQISANLLQVKAFIHTLQQLESLAGIIDELKSSIPQLKKSLLKHQSTLSNLLNELKEISSEPSLEHKNLLLKMLKHQNQWQLKEVGINKALKPFQDQVELYQAINLPDGRKIKLIEKYTHDDGHPWIITSNESAEKALGTMKETDHQTPKATVISTDESPILCLPELLQYLAASSTTMELQLMDKALKNPYKKGWLPLKAGGHKSTDFNHWYRLKNLAKSLVHFQTLAAALTTVDYIANSTENKVLILVYPATCTYEICVFAFGKIIKSDTGSWPLPLEVHVIRMVPAQHLEWVKCIMSSLYYIAQPDMGECCVYLPQCDYSGFNATMLFTVFTELGRKFSTKHRVFLPAAADGLKRNFYQEAENHKIALEFRDFGILPQL